jgi:Cation efflux family
MDGSGRFTSLNDYIKRKFSQGYGSRPREDPPTLMTSMSSSAASADGNQSETGLLLVSTTDVGLLTPSSTTVVGFVGGDGDDMSVSSSNTGIKNYNLRRLAMDLSLYCNLFITLTKLVAYLRTFSLSVLAALLDSVLDVVSQLVLNYTEKHSSMQRSSAMYPAGAARLEPIGVLTCAALMGVSSFVVYRMTCCECQC